MEGNTLRILDGDLHKDKAEKKRDFVSTYPCNS